MILSTKILIYSFILQNSNKMWGELLKDAKERKVYYDMKKEEGRLKEILSAVNM